MTQRPLSACAPDSWKGAMRQRHRTGSTSCEGWRGAVPSLVRLRRLVVVLVRDVLRRAALVLAEAV